MKSGLILCAAVLSLAVPARAADWKSLKPQGYVSDFAGAVDAESRAAIEEYSARVQQATGAQLAFVVLPSLQGEPVEDVANDIFHTWGIGRKKEDDGAMVLLSVGDRKSRLEVGGGLGGILPDSMAGQILDDMRPRTAPEPIRPCAFSSGGTARFGDRAIERRGRSRFPRSALPRFSAPPATAFRGL